MTVPAWLVWVVVGGVTVLGLAAFGVWLFVVTTMLRLFRESVRAGAEVEHYVDELQDDIRRGARRAPKRFSFHDTGAR